jgi:hypothetical protein
MAIGPAHVEKGFAVDVEAGHILLLAGVLLRSELRFDVRHGCRIGRHIADDVERNAARAARHRIAADYVPSDRRTASMAAL